MSNTLENKLPHVTETHELDMLKREDYATDEAYFEAAADLRMKRSSPEFQRALQDVRAEQARREYEQQVQDQAKQFDELCKSIKLDAYDLNKIQGRAQEDAAAMVSSGKVKPSELLSTVGQLEKQYTADLVREKAANAMVNEAVRKMGREHVTVLR